MTNPRAPRSTAEIFDQIRLGRPGQNIQDHPEFSKRVNDGMDPLTPVHLCGWVDDFTSRKDLAATFAPPLAQVAPKLMGDSTDVLLYKAWKVAIGDYPKYVAQQIGDCTSFGSAHAVDLLQCVEIVLLEEATEFREICTEAIYGMGREIANMLGRGDGCYGVAVAKALTDHGAITREKIGPYSGSRAKEWGRKGTPSEVKSQMAPYKVGKAALITTLDEMDAALANLYPSAGGFSQGFSMTRDSNGVCRQSGRWGHETCIVGRRTKDGKRQYCMAQSWGSNVPSGPLTDEQPNFSFWIDEGPMANILSQRDWLTFTNAPDFVKRDVPAAFKHSTMVA